MRTFLKMAGLSVVLVGGSWLTLRFAFDGDLPLAWLTEVAMAAVTITLIVFIARDADNAPVGDWGTLFGLALRSGARTLAGWLWSGAKASRKALLAALQAGKNASKDVSTPAEDAATGHTAAARDA